MPVLSPSELPAQISGVGPVNLSVLKEPWNTERPTVSPAPESSLNSTIPGRENADQERVAATNIRGATIKFTNFQLGKCRGTQVQIQSYRIP